MKEKEIFDDRSNYTIKADGEYTVIEYKERDQINQSQSKTIRNNHEAIHDKR